MKKKFLSNFKVFVRPTNKPDEEGRPAGARFSSCWSWLGPRCRETLLDGSGLCRRLGKVLGSAQTALEPDQPLFFCRARESGATMATATMIFRRCILNPPEWKGDDQHMGSRVYFDLEVEGKRYHNLHVDVVQRIGPGANQEFLEVTEPFGYAGPFNLPVFQGLAEFYYRHVIGADGLVVRVKSSDMRFVGYVMEQEMCVQFEVS